ncbi:MAG: hypothetical protein MZV65_01145 [Chromatiales bacterium]|nr:hypothetical protein [Chromatiales bacterium]
MDAIRVPARPPWAGSRGVPAPLGAAWNANAEGWNFALYSKHATSVTLLLYGADDVRGSRSTPMRLDSPGEQVGARCWHCWRRRRGGSRAVATCYYAYAVDGPDDPAAGLRFDAGKVLLDPYAPGPSSFRRRSTARRPSCAGPTPGRAPARRAGGEPVRAGRVWGAVPSAALVGHGCLRDARSEDSRGATIPACRRTAAARSPASIDKIPYLVEPRRHRGRTDAACSQRDPQELNYWGVHAAELLRAARPVRGGGDAEGAIAEIPGDGPGACTTPASRSSSTSSTTTPRRADEIGPTYVLPRASTTDHYYLLHDDRRRYRNDTGTGNVAARRATSRCARMVVDSLRYWAREMHVDGFRFDLAVDPHAAKRRIVDVERPRRSSDDRFATRFWRTCG